MTDYAAVFKSITADPRYLANLDWGEPRPGHPEGTIRAHIAELERNLEGLRDRVSEIEHAKLLILVHVHDSFKPEAVDGAPVGDPGHHGVLAAEFLKSHLQEPELCDIAILHDEPYAIWWRVRSKGQPNAERFDRLLSKTWDWDLFAAFLIIDGSTEGKSREPLRWILELLSERGLIRRFGPEDAR